MHLGDGRAHLQAGIDLPRVVGIELLAAPFGTGREADLTRPGVAQAAGDLRVDALQFDSAGRSVAMLIESRTDCGVAAGFNRL